MPVTKSATKKTARGRPRKSEAEEGAFRARVIGEARNLFARDGYEGVSMRRVAQAVGCSPAQLYTLFGGKRDLLRHIWEDAFSELADELHNASAEKDPLKRLHALGDAWCRFWLSNPDHYRSIFLIEDKVNEPGERYFVETSESLGALDLIAEAVSESMKKGLLRPDDVAAVSQLFLCGLQGVVFNLITIPEFPWAAKEQMATRMITALIDGVSPH
ncbi:TetR/AcrR family transcriptional regulator [Parvibaculum sp. MBR-TMA-1.3b-4.2]|jgi:AcrR family transcriptional regulator